jgi:hypothetical protein
MKRCGAQGTCGVVACLQEANRKYTDVLFLLANVVRLGIDGIVDILQAHFVVISGTFHIRGFRNHPEVRRYSPDDIIDP